MDATKAYKNRVAQRMTSLLIDAYEQQTVDRHEISILATYIREEFLNKQFTDREILKFVEEMALNVPIFASMLEDPRERPVKNISRHFLEQIAS